MRDAPSLEPLRAKAAPTSSPWRRFALVVAIGLPLYALSLAGAYAYGRAKVADQVEAAVAAEGADQDALVTTRATLEKAIVDQEELRESYLAERATLEAEQGTTPEEAYAQARKKLQAWIEAEGTR